MVSCNVAARDIQTAIQQSAVYSQAVHKGLERAGYNFRFGISVGVRLAPVCDSQARGWTR
jgi:hypothetical protein